MNRVHATSQYTSVRIKCDEQGFIGAELFIEDNGTKRSVASIVYWDAAGQFSVTTKEEIPLAILEELIVEAKKMVT